MALIQFCTYYVSLTLLLSLFKKCQSTAECQNFICKIQHKIDAVPKLSESTHRKECICCHIDLVKERNNLRGQLFDKICSSFCAEPSHWSAWAGWNCGSGIDKGLLWLERFRKKIMCMNQKTLLYLFLWVSRPICASVERDPWQLHWFLFSFFFLIC